LRVYRELATHYVLAGQAALQATCWSTQIRLVA
jgi:hypothetical protein